MRKIYLIIATFALTLGLAGCITINNGDDPNNGNNNGNNGNGTQEQISDERLEEIAKCLTSKDVTMYGAIWCAHCNNQKKAFGEAFQYVNYVECDPNTDLEGAKKCLNDGIEAYPTWRFSDGSKRTGEIPVEELASLVAC